MISVALKENKQLKHGLRRKGDTSSKRMCTETYLPLVLELFFTIRSTIFAASMRMGSENLSASKLHRHRNPWIFGGTEWANLLENGAMRTALHIHIRHK